MPLVPQNETDQRPGVIAGNRQLRNEHVATARGIAEEIARTAVERDREGTRPIAELERLRASGLVNLLIPERLGGEGGTFGDALRVVTEISKADTSIGALLGFHYYVSVVPRLYDVLGDAEEVQRRSAEGRWLWGNVHQPQQADFTAEPDGRGGFVVNGTKPWNTGVTLADVTTVVAHRTDVPELLVAYIPTDREGLVLHDDWDHLGLRLAETVTAEFHDVVVHPDEVIRSTDGSPQVSFPPLYTSFAMPVYGAILIGATWAALERSRDYAISRTEPRAMGIGKAPREDPQTLALFGESLGPVLVAESFLYQVGDEVQEAFESRLTSNARDRGRVSTRAWAARALASETALAVTPRVYDLTGVSATANSWGLDRHWRDVRTLSVHDSVIASLVGVGDHVVNGNARDLPAFIS